MRLYVSDDKNDIVRFLFDYLKNSFGTSEIKFIVSGVEHKGSVSDMKLDETNLEWIEITINDNSFKIPFNIDSIIRLDKGLFYFETHTHTSIAYI